MACPPRKISKANISHGLWEPSDEKPSYRTTTMDLQESVLNRPPDRGEKKKRQVNFTSFRMHQKKLVSEIKIRNIEMISSYQRDYEMQFEPKPRKDGSDLPPLFYGKPHNAFEFTPLMDRKFMDDYLIFPPLERQRRDCLRQLKNKSSVFDWSKDEDELDPCKPCPDTSVAEAEEAVARDVENKAKLQKTAEKVEREECERLVIEAENAAATAEAERLAEEEAKAAKRCEPELKIELDYDSESKCC